MRVRYSADVLPADMVADAPQTPDDLARMRRMVAETNAGFVKVERLDGNIGYIRLDFFMPGDDVARLIAAAMTLVAGTDALIVDVRENHGGDPATVALLVSYLYDEAAEVHINDIYSRTDDSTRQYWNVAGLPAPRYANKPVYVLSSHVTFSGGEEFCYDIQNLKRGKLIGETTGGGANPGGETRLADHFRLFVPTGRAINPVTKTNWEGVGVKPDVAVPAARALDTAYLDALRAQRQRVSAKDAPRLAKEIDDALATIAGKPAH
jgi:C-terminal processing protease CtpA/Prc